MDHGPLRQMLDEARAAWPRVSVSEERFVEAITRLRPVDEELDAWLSRVRVTDLYLTTACADGDAVALEQLDSRYLSRIGATVSRIDSSSSFAEEVRQELRVHLLVAR